MWLRGLDSGRGFFNFLVAAGCDFREVDGMAGLLALDWKSLAKRENMDRREIDRRGFLGISAVGAAAVELGLLFAPSHPT